MNKPVLFVFVAVLVLTAGCLRQPASPAEDKEKTRENGLRIANFTVEYHRPLEPGDRTHLLLRLENTNEDPVRDVHATLSNTNPLTIGELTTSEAGTTDTCAFARLRGIEEAAVGEEVLCTWQITVPDDVSPPFTVPATATVTHTATVQTPLLDIQFTETPETITSQTATVSNKELQARIKTKDTQPLDTTVVELTISLSNTGTGDFVRTPNGNTKINLSYHGSLTDVFTEEQPQVSGHARPCPNQTILQGEQARFTCSFTIEEEKLTDGVIRSIGVQANYSYRQTRHTQVRVATP